MAKKKAAKKAAPAKKATKKKSAPRQDDEMMEITLDAAEQKAFDLVQSSDDVCDELETVVTAAVAKAVGTVFKKHKIALTAAQAENVALILFG